MRGKFRHNSNFGVGPSYAGNFNTPNCQNVPPCLHSHQAHKQARRRPTSHSEVSKMNGRDKQMGRRQQRNNI